MVVTVSPVVDWDTHNPMDLKAAEDAVPRFLTAHPDLNRTIGALSALR
jgi:hypothetical protein